MAQISIIGILSEDNKIETHIPSIKNVCRWAGGFIKLINNSGERPLYRYHRIPVMDVSLGDDQDYESFESDITIAMNVWESEDHTHE